MFTLQTKKSAVAAALGVVFASSFVVAESQYSVSGNTLLDRKAVALKSTEGEYAQFFVQYYTTLASVKSRFPNEMTSYQSLGRWAVDDYRTFGAKSPEFQFSLQLLMRELNDGAGKTQQLRMIMADLAKAHAHLMKAENGGASASGGERHKGPSIDLTNPNLKVVSGDLSRLTQAMGLMLSKSENESLLEPLKNSETELSEVLDDQASTGEEVGGALLQVRSKLHLFDSRLKALMDAPYTTGRALEVVQLQKAIDDNIALMLGEKAAPRTGSFRQQAGQGVAPRPPAAAKAANAPVAGAVEGDLGRLLQQGQNLIAKMGETVSLAQRAQLFASLSESLSDAMADLQSSGLQSTEFKKSLRDVTTSLDISQKNIVDQLKQNPMMSPMRAEFQKWVEELRATAATAR